MDLGRSGRDLQSTLTYSVLLRMMNEGFDLRCHLATYKDNSLCLERAKQRRACDSSSFLLPVVSVCVSAQTRRFDPIETSLLGATPLMRLAAAFARESWPWLEKEKRKEMEAQGNTI